MKKAALFWILSIVLTLFLAIYQRVTGPTYPLKGSYTLGGKTVKYELPRSSDGALNTMIKIKIDDPSVTGQLTWKRYKTNDEFSDIVMNNNNGRLEAELPKQPAAGKLVYSVKLQKGEESIVLPDNTPAILRFRDPVPMIIIVPHIMIIFFAMLFSTRTGLEYFCEEPKLRKYTLWTIWTLFIGGFIFGPLMQYYAFGTFWTGIPFGYDLTDNKTLIAMIVWLVILFRLKKSKNPKRLALIGAVVMFLVFLIPHSLFGSELDYSKAETGNMNRTEMPLQK